MPVAAGGTPSISVPFLRVLGVMLSPTQLARHSLVVTGPKTPSPPKLNARRLPTARYVVRGQVLGDDRRRGVLLCNFWYDMDVIKNETDARRCVVCQYT